MTSNNPSTFQPFNSSTSSDVVIKVENLSKQYRLGTISHRTLTKDIQSWWARFRGKEDPNLRIDQTLQQFNSSTVKGSSSTLQPFNLSTVVSDRFWALDDVSFEVKQGEVLGIIGRNGAGKSTLLKILSKVTTPTKGNIKIKGRVASLLEVGTGFHPELTGRENIYLNGAILGMTKDEIKKKFDEIVAFAEVEKFIDTPVKRYSSGMYVRLAFAVAAHLEPEILLVDEVLAVGDAAFQKKCLGKMGDVAKEGRTVLFVSHNMAAIQKLCSRAVWIDNGKICNFGKTSEIVDSYFKCILGKNENLEDLPLGFVYFRDSSKINKDYSIIGIQLLDEQGNTIKELGTWDYVRFRIHYYSRCNLKRGSVVLQIQTNEEVPLILSSTEPDFTVPCSIEVGEHYADCIFPELPLASGEYFIGAGLAVPGIEFVCWDSNLLKIHVAKRDVFKSGLPPSSNRYLIAVKHSWELQDNKVLLEEVNSY